MLLKKSNGTDRVTASLPAIVTTPPLPTSRQLHPNFQGQLRKILIPGPAFIHIFV